MLNRFQKRTGILSTIACVLLVISFIMIHLTYTLKRTLLLTSEVEEASDLKQTPVVSKQFSGLSNGSLEPP